MNVQKILYRNTQETRHYKIMWKKLAVVPAALQLLCIAIPVFLSTEVTLHWKTFDALRGSAAATETCNSYTHIHYLLPNDKWTIQYKSKDMEAASEAHQWSMLDTSNYKHVTQTNAIQIVFTYLLIEQTTNTDENWKIDRQLSHRQTRWNILIKSYSKIIIENIYFNFQRF